MSGDVLLITWARPSAAPNQPGIRGGGGVEFGGVGVRLAQTAHCVAKQN